MVSPFFMPGFAQNWSYSNHSKIDGLLIKVLQRYGIGGFAFLQRAIVIVLVEKRIDR